MTSTSKTFTRMILVFGIMYVCLFPTIGHAKSSSGTLINEENVYLLSEQIDLKTPSLKDVFALGSDVIIDAPVSGDLQVAARSVRVNAPVSGDIRIAAGEIYIQNTHIQGDMLLAGGNITVDKTVSASGATMIFGATTIFNGNTEKSFLLKSSETEVGGIHKGKVEITSSILKILDSFKVDGELKINTNSSIDIKPGTVNGKITKEQMYSEDSTVWEKMNSAFSTFLSLFIGLMALVWIAPRDVAKRVRFMKAAPLSSFLKGFLGGIILPLLLLILSFTVIGFPFIIALSFVYLALVFLSPLYAVLYIGTLIMPSEDINLRTLSKSAVVGSLVVTLILQIPVIGMFVMLLISALAFGTFLRKREESM